jgi:hypothetical protein
MLPTQQNLVNVGFRSSNQPTSFHYFELNQQVLTGDISPIYEIKQGTGDEKLRKDQNLRI